mgnify:CR=1 FL=1
MKLGERIRFIRKREGLSQLQFANNLGIARSYISALETESVPLPEVLMLKICLTYNINPWWLVHGKGPINLNWRAEDIKKFERQGIIPRQVKAFFVVNDWLLNELDTMIKIEECVGPDILKLNDPQIKPGDPVVVDILRECLQKLEKKTPQASKTSHTGEGGDFTGLDLAFIKVLRALSHNSVKDLYALLASKARRLPKEKRRELAKEIKDIEDVAK